MFVPAGPLRLAVVVLGLVGLAACAVSRPAPELTLEPYVFEARDGTTVDAEHGVVAAPENRADPDARLIELHFVRFASTSDHPGAPIIFLAGGPGGSGINAARGPLFPLFMAMREFGDVIAFDERVSGLSNAIPRCETDRRLPLDAPFDDEEVARLVALAAADCAAFWREAGVDLAGYTTVESARDIDDLRRALGAEKVSLWGVSYGARLAITALREMPGHVDRAVLAAVEPPGATTKLPASVDAYVARLQAVIDADPRAAAAYPDVAGLMRGVHARLDAEPLRLSAPDGAGGTATVQFGGPEMRLLMSGGLAEPANAALVVSVYAAMAEGAPPPAILTPRMLGLRRRFDPIVMDGTEAMDFTAGASQARLALARAQGPSSIFGDLQRFEQPVRRALGLDDLGEGYRAPAATDVPTLVLSGTLDVRYDPAEEAEALSRFSRLRHVTAINGGHNIYMQDPIIAETVLAFMRGEDVPDTVTLDPPAFVN